jgi:diaminopimelate epimerase
MTVRFTKMHGLGNDFIIVDDRKDEFSLLKAPGFARAVCHRGFGVGGDGLVFLKPSQMADFRMRVFNSDGSEAEMCGNAIRCLAKYAYEEGITAAEALYIETLKDVRQLRLKVEGAEVTWVEVDMGEPILDPRLIPVDLKRERVVGEEVTAGGITYTYTAVSMGNPHCVIFGTDDPAGEAKTAGPLLESHPVFPKKTNVEFVRVLNRQEIEVWVFERGAGLTLACGTGACAAVVAAVLNGYTGREVAVHLPGGTLKIVWAADNRVFMAGPARYVCTGDLHKAWLANYIERGL